MKKPKKSELGRFAGIYEKASDDIKNIALGLVQNAVFMETQLSKLQKIIDEKGFSEEYQNGQNQWGVKKSAETDIYNSMIKNYNTVIKNLSEILPSSAEDKDELTAFLKGRRK